MCNSLAHDTGLFRRISKKIGAPSISTIVPSTWMNFLKVKIFWIDSLNDLEVRKLFHDRVNLTLPFSRFKFCLSWKITFFYRVFIGFISLRSTELLSMKPQILEKVFYRIGKTFVRNNDDSLIQSRKVVRATASINCIYKCVECTVAKEHFWIFFISNNDEHVVKAISSYFYCVLRFISRKRFLRKEN